MSLITRLSPPVSHISWNIRFRTRHTACRIERRKPALCSDRYGECGTEMEIPVPEGSIYTSVKIRLRTSGLHEEILEFRLGLICLVEKRPACLMVKTRKIIRPERPVCLSGDNGRSCKIVFRGIDPVVVFHDVTLVAGIERQRPRPVLGTHGSRAYDELVPSVLHNRSIDICVDITVLYRNIVR